MSHQVVWTDDIFRFVCEKARLSDKEQQILKTRVFDGMTIIEQAEKFHCDRATIIRKTNIIKIKYDAIQKIYPDVLRPRVNSVYEKYMDEH